MTAEGGDAVVLPAGLRERVLEASRQARAVGRPSRRSPRSRLRRRSAARPTPSTGCCGALGDNDWQVPVLCDLDVQGLVGHLIGVEDDMQRCLSGDPEVAVNHVESTQSAAARQAGRAAALTRTEWRQAADRTLDLVHGFGDPLAEVAMHGMRLPLGALLIVRAFELWIHDNDIRRAVGLPPSVPEPAALGLMTRLAVRLLPHAAARTGLHEPVNVHLVLTGPGGGTWDVAIGERPPDPVSIRIIADTVGFCRLAANRVTPADLDLHVTGDPDGSPGCWPRPPNWPWTKSPGPGDPPSAPATYQCRKKLRAFRRAELREGSRA